MLNFKTYDIPTEYLPVNTVSQSFTQNSKNQNCVGGGEKYSFAKVK